MLAFECLQHIGDLGPEPRDFIGVGLHRHGALRELGRAVTIARKAAAKAAACSGEDPCGKTGGKRRQKSRR